MFELLGIHYTGCTSSFRCSGVAELSWDEGPLIRGGASPIRRKTAFNGYGINTLKQRLAVE